MNKSCLLPTLVLALLVSTLAPLSASAQRNGGPAVAIIDLNYIFKNHKRFKMMKSDLQHEVEAAEAEVKAAKESLRKMQQKAEDFKRGTPEYKEIEEEWTRQSAELQLKVNSHKMDFVELEAKNYYAVYKEILEEVERHAEEHGIDLVLRFTGDPIDTTDPDQVLSEINKSVVWHSESVDITITILDNLNANATPERRGSRPETANSNNKAGVPRRKSSK